MPLSGLYSYDLLSSNSEYCDKFMYWPSDLAERQNFFKKKQNKVVSKYTKPEMKLISLMLVRAVTDLAYMPSAQAKSLEFNPEYLWKLWKNMQTYQNGNN